MDHDQQSSVPSRLNMVMEESILYLASASPRRTELLTQAGISHQVLKVPSPPGEDEPVLPGEHPYEYIRRTAMDKATRAIDWIARRPELVEGQVLTADTSVILDGDILGKPQSPLHAKNMLRQLSGKTHEVMTAVVLWHGGTFKTTESLTVIRFRHLTEKEIDTYCHSGEPMGKAGAYAIQGSAEQFVVALKGSRTGVIGLPIEHVVALLNATDP